MIRLDTSAGCRLAMPQFAVNVPATQAPDSTTGAHA